MILWEFCAMILLLGVLRGEDQCREEAAEALVPGSVRGMVASIVVL